LKKPYSYDFGERCIRVQNSILFKLGSGEEEVISLFHIHLNWWTCSYTQAFLYEKFLKIIPLMKRKLTRNHSGNKDWETILPVHPKASDNNLS
jgi:hypothetical protein